MLNTLKNIGRAIIPKPLFKLAQPIYHGAMARIAASYFNNPSKGVAVIGITGTAGKSTTVMMLAHILNSNGLKTGYVTTVGSSNGDTEKINKHGLSMPGGWLLQKTLSELVANGCKYVVVECTSEGLAQNRHTGINFNAALFTNLSPAHLDTHGSFENYRNAKRKLFGNLKSPSVIGVNIDDPNYLYFSSIPSNKKFGVSTREDKTPNVSFPFILAEKIAVDNTIKFSIKDVEFNLPLAGSFNIPNALLAIGMAEQLGVTITQCAASLQRFGKIPGRMEIIPNNLNATIVVDYAPEPAAMEASLRAAQLIPHSRIIHVFGSTGGHRDVSKRFSFGRISASFADTIIVTNDDVYDSDPNEIAVNIQEGIGEVLPEQAKVKNVIVELDRKTAIEKAIAMLQPNDLLLITGKGSEQFLVLPQNKRIEWDDRSTVKEALKKR